MEPRIKPSIWIKALLRRLNMELIPAVIVRSGDPDGGAIYLKVNRFAHGCQVFSRSYGQGGERIWAPATGEAPVDEQQADQYLSRQTNFDPDCWIMEIEDPNSKFTIATYVD